MPTAVTSQTTSTLQSARDAMYQDLIISAGETIFAAEGYEATRMQDIAASAGISLKTLYNYFPGKADLFHSIKNVRGDRLVHEVESVISQLARKFAEEPLEVILEGMETHLRFFMGHPDYLRIILQDGYSWFDEQARADPGQEDLWQRGRVLIENVFQFGIDAGVFVQQLPPQLLSHLISQQQTRLANWVSGEMSQEIDDVIALAKADFVRFFCVPELSQMLLNKDGSKLLDNRPGWAELLQTGADK